MKRIKLYTFEGIKRYTIYIKWNKEMHSLMAIFLNRHKIHPCNKWQNILKTKLCAQTKHLFKSLQDVVALYKQDFSSSKCTSFSRCRAVSFSCVRLLSNSALSARFVSSEDFVCESRSCFLYRSTCALKTLLRFTSCNPLTYQTPINKALRSCKRVLYINQTVNQRFY